MTPGIWILGNQLSFAHPALQQFTLSPRPPVLFIESLDFARDRPYHRQKLVLVWSAMRHFAAELTQAGWDVTYCTEDTFTQPLKAWIQRYRLEQVWLMEPEDFPFKQILESLELPCPLTFLDNPLFLWSQTEFVDWASSRKSLLLESFYRESRKRFQVLMNGKEPEGEPGTMINKTVNPLKESYSLPNP